MNYEEVSVGDRVYLQTKKGSEQFTLPPNAIQSLCVRDCPMEYCIKIEFGNVTSVCKYLTRYGGEEQNRPSLESVECSYDQSPADSRVMLLGVYSCPMDRLGCIWLEQDSEKRCQHLAGILEPVSAVSSHYCVVCNHPADAVAE